MADLTVSLLYQGVMGNKRVHIGTATGSGTGGEINTGLHVCEFISLTAHKSAIVADAPTVNETMPCAGSAVTIIHTSGCSYVEFMAVGY
jgi:hypothetical protein